MKTYNGKRISKKHIVQVLRSMNTTEIFRLYHQIYGGKVTANDVYTFIDEFITAYRTYRKICTAVFNSLHHYKPIDAPQVHDQSRKALDFSEKNAKHFAVQALREEIARGFDGYTKRPIMGMTHLYFASPVYGHSDYNKWRSVEIKGNERFCEVICRLADKYFPLNNN